MTYSSKNRLNIMRYLFFMLLVTLSLSGSFAQSTNKAESPEAMVVLLKRNAIEDPSYCADRMHPEALKLFKTLVLEFIQSTPAEGRETALSVLFDGPMSEKNLANTNPTQLYASFLRKLAMQTTPEMAEIYAKSEITPIGSVAEADVTHVVVRTSLKDRDYRKLDVISFKKYGNSWGALLGEELEFKIRNMIRSQQARRSLPK